MTPQLRKIYAEKVKTHPDSLFYYVDFTPEEREEIIFSLGDRIYGEMGEERDLWIHYRYENRRINKARLWSKDGALTGEIHHNPKDHLLRLHGRIIVKLELRNDDEKEYSELFNIISSQNYSFRSCQ